VSKEIGEKAFAKGHWESTRHWRGTMSGESEQDTLAHDFSNAENSESLTRTDLLQHSINEYGTVVTRDKGLHCSFFDIALDLKRRKE
jgi:hypothetical protein